MQYNEIIRQLREDNNLRQIDLARILSTEQSYYAKYENGIRPLPLTQLKKICQYYEVSADYILGLPNTYARTRQELANRKNR